MGGDGKIPRAWGVWLETDLVGDRLIQLYLGDISVSGREGSRKKKVKSW